MQGWVCPGLHPSYAADTPADASRGPEQAAGPEGGHEIKRSGGRGHPKGGWEKRWKEIMPLFRCEKRSSYYSYFLCCSPRFSPNIFSGNTSILLRAPMRLIGKLPTDP